MLILTRRFGESIKINDDITITVLSPTNFGRKITNVKLGIEAPREIAVHREEIWEKIQNEKKEKEDEY